MEWTGETGYLNLLQTILDTGEVREDRTGVGTISLFGESLKFDLQKGFPALTTKKLAFKAVKSELIWFLSGSEDERSLAEIHYGKPRKELTDKKTIWTDNFNDFYFKHSVNSAPIYGSEWKFWMDIHQHTHVNGTNSYGTIDQVSKLIECLKNNPYSRRHIISAWNVADIERMVLPPCHVMSQYYVHNDKRLDCVMFQRSADFCTGSPFNVASYALLTHMLAQVCDLIPGKLIINMGDVHVYNTHVENAKEQITRIPKKLPTLWLDPDIKNINDFTMNNIKLQNYESWPAINYPMAV